MDEPLIIGLSRPIAIQSTFTTLASLLYGEEHLRRAPNIIMMGPRGFEKHGIVLAQLINTVSRYPQEGTIYTLICLVASRLKTVSDKTCFTQFWYMITSVFQCSHALEVRMYIDHIMCNKKHVWCGITDVFWIGAYRAEIVYILTFLLRYESPMMGPVAHPRRLDCLKIKTLSHAKVILCRWYTNERPHIKHGWSVIRRAQLRPSEKSNALAGGPS